MTPYRTPAPTPAPPPPRFDVLKWCKFHFLPVFIKCPYCHTRRCPHGNVLAYLATGCMVAGFAAILYAACLKWVFR